MHNRLLSSLRNRQCQLAMSIIEGRRFKSNPPLPNEFEGHSVKAVPFSFQTGAYEVRNFHKNFAWQSNPILDRCL
jgi:hypothetical protein